MAVLRSVNLGTATAVEYSELPTTGIDKRPAAGPVLISAPVAGSGVGGDLIADLRHHGGPDQAVYAYAREDLDAWSAELGRELRDGEFGENLTTVGLDVNGALIGERWRIGAGVVLEVSCARIPCRTFAGFLDERGWVRRFTERAAPGAYLRVVTPGTVRAGDDIEVRYRPDHEVTVALAFRAMTTERDLLPRLVVAAALKPAWLAKARRA